MNDVRILTVRRTASDLPHVQYLHTQHPDRRGMIDDDDDEGSHVFAFSTIVVVVVVAAEADSTRFFY